ncbi:MAG: hypothetical protein OEO23_00825 [Gemmatimonadota bacterium]|nr:hypothetical protein [Gemmatimonadota bacterium]
MTMAASCLTACSHPSTPLPTMELSDRPIRAVEHLRSLEFALADDLGIVFIADLVRTPTGYALADSGGWVLMLDEELAVEYRFGGEGSGPGELRLPQDLEILPGGQVAVFDSGNNRITVLDREAKLVESVPARNHPLTDFAARPQEPRFVFGRPSRESLISTLGSNPEPFGTLPPALRDALDSQDPLRSISLSLAADREGRVHHFDELTNTLLSYSPDGTLRRALTLPARVLSNLAKQRADLEEAFGRGAVVAQTWMLGMGVYDLSPVLTGTLPGVAGFAFVVDPEGVVATPIVADPSLPPSDFHGVGPVVLEDDRVTVVNRTGIHQYRIEWPSHLTPGR